MGGEGRGGGGGGIWCCGGVVLCVADGVVVVVAAVLRGECCITREGGRERWIEGENGQREKGRVG